LFVEERWGKGNFSGVDDDVDDNDGLKAVERGWNGGWKGVEKLGRAKRVI